MHINETIGRRVLNVWREMEGVKCEGVVTAIEGGVNGGARVRFDGRDYSVAMCLRDLALIETYPAPGSRLSDMARD